MGLIREPKNVDFSMKSRPLTEKEHKELSEFIKKSKAGNQLTEEELKEFSEIIKKSKAANLPREKIRTRKKATMPASTSK